MKLKIDSNIKMWCRHCQASTKGDSCSWCVSGLTVCAECGYCFACQTKAEQRTEEKTW